MDGGLRWNEYCLCGIVCNPSPVSFPVSVVLVTCSRYDTTNTSTVVVPGVVSMLWFGLALFFFPFISLPAKKIGHF